MDMLTEEYTLSRIGSLLREGKVKKRHDMIVYLFQVWLEKHGVKKEKMKILEEYKGIRPDIIVFKEDNSLIVWEIIEPGDPNYDILNPEIRKKLENLLIRIYRHILKPKFIILTDGLSMIIYNSDGQIIKILDDLSSTVADDDAFLETIAVK
ncbi:MAG: hypothetical protein ACTSVW_02365 [Candidatus Njordarchaeales archaeon]